jgi:hypothetical protein
MEKLDIRGITSPKPMKMLRISTIGSDKVTIMGGITSPAHKEVIQTLTQISI